MRRLSILDAWGLELLDTGMFIDLSNLKETLIVPWGIEEPNFWRFGIDSSPARCNLCAIYQKETEHYSCRCVLTLKDDIICQFTEEPGEGYSPDKAIKLFPPQN